MHGNLVRRYAAAVPRYTSYPTAPNFHAGVGNESYRQWLRAIEPDAALSLYVHIPFCDRLCWFCACNTRQTRKYAPVTRYLEALFMEIASVGETISSAVGVRALHLGGGSPTLLTPQDIQRLGDRLRESFRLLPDAEISVEMDPNDMDDARFDALSAIGMTRASLGIQDFDPKVQEAINREQSFEQTRGVVDGARRRGVGSINFDLLYGLPHQTRESLAATVSKSLSLEPDRIALFGYAHVPWFRKHQTMIDEAWLPGPAERFSQRAHADEVIRAAGYEAIGIDHYAKPADSLAAAQREGSLRRNFQGYTTDTAETLVGLGASSIGAFRQGYVQNATSTPEYQRLVHENGLAAVRGIEFSQEDRLRAWVIERLMCGFFFSISEMFDRFGNLAHVIVEEAERLASDGQDGQQFRKEGDRFVIAEHARPFARTLAATFDAYFGEGKARHSAAI
ncbi:Oxygen-independent coproporphyrinogen III oxidase [Labrys miyagiensis]